MEEAQRNAPQVLEHPGARPRGVSLMDSTSVQKTTRIERGIALYRDRGEEIAHVRGTVWSVPSCSGSSAELYLVELTGGICTCPDRPPAGEVCKHATAATIASSKTAACSGCGARRRRRELVEVQDGGHDGMMFRDGDRICRPCADRSGVLR